MSARLSLTDGMRQLGLSYEELWSRYIAIGGNGTVEQVTQHLHSDRCPDEREHNVLAQALNDAFTEQGLDHPVAYRHFYRPEP